MTGFDVSMSGKSLSLSLAVDRLVASAAPPFPGELKGTPPPLPPIKTEPLPPPRHSKGPLSPYLPRPALGRRAVVLVCQGAAVFDLVIWHILGRTHSMQLLVLRLLGVAICSCVCVDVLPRFHACLLLLAASLHFEGLFWHDAPDRVSLATLAAALAVTAHRCVLARGSWLAGVLVAALASAFVSTLLLAAWLPSTVPVGDMLFLALAAAAYSAVDTARPAPPLTPAASA